MKGIWGEPDREYFWEASLTGDLVCGSCEKTLLVDRVYNEGLHPCRNCGKKVWLSQEIILLANQRASRAFPQGRPKEEGPQWKGDGPYGS